MLDNEDSRAAALQLFCKEESPVSRSNGAG